MTAERDRAWIGVDIGKTHHWVCVVDETGQKLLSLKVLNDEAQILEMITAVGGLAGGRVWAIDILGTPSALLLALLAQVGEPVRYASGRVVAAMSAAYVGEGVCQESGVSGGFHSDPQPSSALGIRSAKVTAKALSAGFQRIVHRV